MNHLEIPDSSVAELPPVGVVTREQCEMARVIVSGYGLQRALADSLGVTVARAIADAEARGAAAKPLAGVEVSMALETVRRRLEIPGSVPWLVALDAFATIRSALEKCK